MAGGEPERARPLLDELIGWRDVQVGELRDEVGRVETLARAG